MKAPLRAEEVRKVISPESIATFKESKCETEEMIIGQERAVKALKFGIGIRDSGFNIYVSGAPGTGKLTAVKSYVEQKAKYEVAPNDWCYVYNFKDPYQPNKISLPGGMAAKLKKDMKTLISEAQQVLLKAFESEEYSSRRKQIIDKLEEEQTAIFGTINKHAEQDSLIIKQKPWEIFCVPALKGEPMSDEEFDRLDVTEKNKIAEKQLKLQAEIKAGIRATRANEKASNQKLSELEREVAGFTISNLMEEAEAPYLNLHEVISYFNDVKKDILENLPEFLSLHKENPLMQFAPRHGSAFLSRYEINVFVDNSECKGAPVVIEMNPTYSNLFGRIDKESYMGTLMTDFTLIHKGSLHKANGGYLIIRVDELFRNMFSYECLKRALRNKEIAVEDPAEQLGLTTVKILKPESIPLNVKVILIGNPTFYHLLYMYDSDFKELFKLKADFDTRMEMNNENVSDYIGFVNLLIKREELFPAADDAVAKIIEYGIRLAEDRNKLSTRFGEISDIIREASYYAASENSKFIQASHVKKAIEEKKFRSNLIHEKINEMIVNQQIMIDTTGKKCGQLNGLSVFDMGDITFGKPDRITCSTSLGKDGIIGIEREAELSGPIHTKGVLILSGYLAQKFIQDKPVSLNARLVFEQSYDEVEGDSASSAELFCILSSLSGQGIKQGIAVTGSINQKGEIQAIGAVNEKIEGYFEVCKQIGLNGEQGVIIPYSNMRNLMLKEEIQEAVKDEKFKIWPIKTIDEGIEILTGIPFGDINEQGTIAYLVNKTLNGYADKYKEFASDYEKEEAEVV